MTVFQYAYIVLIASPTTIVIIMHKLINNSSR